PVWRAKYEARVKEKGFTAYFDYSYQWDYFKKYEDAGICALLGTGFDPGVTQVFCAYAQNHYFDTIETIDILDCNDGDDGDAFATSFKSRIDVRDVSSYCSYIEHGKWVETIPSEIKSECDFDEVGVKAMYLLPNEEMESLGKNS